MSLYCVVCKNGEMTFEAKELISALPLDKSLNNRFPSEDSTSGLYNLEVFKKEIFSCMYWDQNGIKKLVSRFENHFDKSNRASEISKSLIYRLYLLSAWLNKNRYVHGK